jgi:hypothetical protein
MRTSLNSPHVFLYLNHVPAHDLGFVAIPDIFQPRDVIGEDAVEALSIPVNGGITPLLFDLHNLPLV